MTKDISNKSILVVDDDERMLCALDRVLTNQGATVTCSSWVGSAIEILTNHNKRVDLMIIDLHMPFISGLTAMYAIQNLHRKLPIIVLTAYGSPDVKDECLRLGASAFLEKPLDSHVLLDEIKGVFSTESRTKADRN